MVDLREFNGKIVYAIVGREVDYYYLDGNFLLPAEISEEGECKIFLPRRPRIEDDLEKEDVISVHDEVLTFVGDKIDLARQKGEKSILIKLSKPFII